MKTRISTIFIDLLIVFITFLLILWWKPEVVKGMTPDYWKSFWIFLTIWLLVSLMLEKYHCTLINKYRDVVFTVIIANVSILAIVSILIFSFKAYGFSRLVVYGIIGLASLQELIFGYLFYKSKKFQAMPHMFMGLKEDKDILDSDRENEQQKAVILDDPIHSGYDEDYLDNLRELIITETGKEVYQFVENHINPDPVKNLIIDTSTRFNIAKYPQGRFVTIINFKRINDIRRINKFFETANEKLPVGGIFIDNVETYVLRKQRVLAKYPKGLNWFIYFLDWWFKRVFPKLKITKSIYFFITAGRNRVLSKAETFGRLYSCGFEMLDEAFIAGSLYFIARKVKKPAFDYNPTYGPFIKLKRKGKNGKIFKVYKFRTMHAYSEYLQEYIHAKNDLQQGGKFADDFRITTLGRILRKLWLDELPMFINLFKGDMKLFGIRPLSTHYFNLYTEELKEKRIKYKPGLIPPFYVDLPKTLEEIMESEMRYLEAYEKHPFLTDWRYFWKALYNIIIKRARSA